MTSRTAQMSCSTNIILSLEQLTTSLRRPMDKVKTTVSEHDCGFFLWSKPAMDREEAMWGFPLQPFPLFQNNTYQSLTKYFLTLFHLYWRDSQQRGKQNTVVSNRRADEPPKRCVTLSELLNFQKSQFIYLHRTCHIYTYISHIYESIK